MDALLSGWGRMQQFKQPLITVSDEKLQIHQVVGRGKGSVVYRGFDFSRSADVAVKVAIRPMANHQRALEVTHPFIVSNFDYRFDTDRGVERSVRPFIDGASLEKLLVNIRPLHVRDRERLTGRELLSFIGHAAGVACDNEGAFDDLAFSQVVALLGFQLASALDAAHKEGFVHQNLKASNVIISLSGSAYLMDFNTPQGLFPSVMGVYEKADRFSLISLLWELADGRILRSDALATLLRSEPEKSLSALLLRFLHPDYFRKGTGAELKDELWRFLSRGVDGVAHTA